MTTYQQAIDYVNSYVREAIPAFKNVAPIPSSAIYTVDSLNTIPKQAEKHLVEMVREKLEQGYTVDQIQSWRGEPIELMNQAVTDLGVAYAKAGTPQFVSINLLNNVAGKVYLAMLDNPPKQKQPTTSPFPPIPSTGGYTKATEDAAVNAALDKVDAAVRGARR